MSQICTIARAYPNALGNFPKETLDYDNFTPKFDNDENYCLIKKLGKGKYSEVFEAIHTPTKNTVVLKVLKPVKKRKIKREIKILEMLRGGVNIINLLATLSVDRMKITALVFEKISNVNFKCIYLDLNEYDIKYYMYEILKALDYCHSKGIMHRDIKPHNIIVDHPHRKLQLIDWGLAEFYFAGQDYNVRVASRYYKGPELLVEYVYYDYSLDMWSLGCMFAAMIFKKDPFFHGSSNEDQLVQIVKVLGSSGLNGYLEKYNIKIDSTLRDKLHGYNRKTWERFVRTENEYLINEETINFLESLLLYDHIARMTAKEALQHSYFFSGSK